MNAEKFAYWLQGALELNPDMLEKGMTPEQAQTIQDHLNLVFNKVTPDRFKKEECAPLNILDLDLHKGSGNPPPQHPGSTSDVSDTLFCATMNSKANFSDISEFTTSELQEIRADGWQSFAGGSGRDGKFRLPPEELNFSLEHSIEKILSYGYIVGCTQKGKADKQPLSC